MPWCAAGAEWTLTLVNAPADFNLYLALMPAFWFSVNGLVTTSTPAIRAVRGVVAGLRDDVAELHLRSASARQCAMTAPAVTLATAIALQVRVEATWWAAIGALVSIRTTAPASMQRGGLRIIGTVIGLLLTSWLIEDQVALSLVLLVVSTLGVLWLQVSGHGYAAAAKRRQEARDCSLEDTFDRCRYCIWYSTADDDHD